MQISDKATTIMLYVILSIKMIIIMFAIIQIKDFSIIIFFMLILSLLIFPPLDLILIKLVEIKGRLKKQNER